MLSGSNSQRTNAAEVAACASAFKIYLVSRISLFVFSPESNLNLLVTGGAGFIGSNLALTLQEKFPNGRLTIIDDFRSGDFKNLEGYAGDFIAQDLAKLDWRKQFGDEKFDAIFHLASITDTTLHDQFVQVHDNVESFRRLLRFARADENARHLRVIGLYLRSGERSQHGVEWRRARECLRVFQSDHG